MNAWAGCDVFMKMHFFLRHMWRSLFDFFVQTVLIRLHNTLFWLFFFIKIVDKYYGMCSASLKILDQIFAVDCLSLFMVFPRFQPHRWGDWLLDSPQLYNSGFLFHPVLWTGEKTHLDYAEISPNWTLNHRHVAVFGHLLRNTAHILHKAFPYANVHEKYSSYILFISIWCQLSLSLLFFGHPKQNGGLFSVIWSCCLNWTSRTWRMVGAGIATFHFTKLSTNGCFDEIDMP